MDLVLVGGNAHPALAEALGAALGVVPADRILERFPDGDVRATVRSPVRGADVYLVQPLSPLADAHLVELLFLADGCRRAGAARVTGIVPYLAWARQDRRRVDGEALGARLAADLLATRLDRIVAIDVHGSAAEALFSIPLVHLTALPALAAALGAAPRDAVVVAPDLGAAKRAEALARLLALPSAIVHKVRMSAREVRARGIAGEVAGLAPIVVDDMISTAATIEAAAGTLLEAGCRPEITVVATHALLVAGAVERLARIAPARVVVSDTVPVALVPATSVAVVSVAPLLAEAIRRLHADAPLGNLLLGL